MDLRLVVPFLPLVAACGNYWVLDESLPSPCEKRLFFTDTDGDGWGDPYGVVEERCNGDVERQLTATNGRDCDDSVAGITGRVGSVCPNQLAQGDAVELTGVVYGDREFLVVHGGAAPEFYGNVVQHKCRAWGGGVQTAGQDTETTDDDTWEPAGDLATFASRDEWDQVQIAIDRALDESTAEWPVFAGFVGVGWSGDVSREWVGSWDWLDGDEQSSFSLESIPYCDEQPTPGDILPKMTPEDPLHGPTFEQQLPKWRLSLVKPYGSDWCWGLPSAALPPSDSSGSDTGIAADGMPAYTLTNAHYICERPQPNEEQWEGTSIGPVDSGAD